MKFDLKTNSKLELGRASHHKLVLLGLLFSFGVTGCITNDPYERNRAPVEIRRGEVYDKPIYEQQGNPQGQTFPAPDRTRPVYGPAENFPQSESSDEYQPTNQTYEESVPAVARLVNQAENYITNEDYQSAVASAESALRLNPQSVSAYHTLSRAYLYQNRFEESEQMALRAISILRSKGPNVAPETASDLWLVIAQTRRERGDQDGAEKAMRQAGGRY